MSSARDYTVYALKVHSSWAKRVHESLVEGEARFGWSYLENADLKKLRERVAECGLSSLSEEERACYQPFLLEIIPGDYVVYVNVPCWGRCTVAKVDSHYYWRWSSEDGDFNHRFKVDPESVFDFDRNDAEVDPYLSARLKLQGRWWHIYAPEEFEALLKAAGDGGLGTPSTADHQVELLSRKTRPLMVKLTEAIHATHPGKSLENLIARVLQRIPEVKDVDHKADHGADIIAVVETCHPITGELLQSKCVIQVKSFEGEHGDTSAVGDIRRAFETYPDATEGLIISTAREASEDLENRVEELKRDVGKPVNLMIGEEVAAFLVKYGWELLRYGLGEARTTEVD